ncbi:ribosome small subunit-dependent GTPase A [candidate division TA06 bacterium]|uniref:Small ribosomal subunit biogenesis GTPase RsgA n=1 Tax=candidate division TA06 bacterium TaxID=2250710 RepID=A0A933I9S4_UNCT6|nr:ribosome small subunit-dependent GTPase A [candidate division TA06 bacterium]
MDLLTLGWDDHFEHNFKLLVSTLPENKNLLPGRVAAVHLSLVRVLTEPGELELAVSGKLRDKIALNDLPEKWLTGIPAVGDWVVFDHDPANRSGTIKAILPRKNCFTRNRAGTLTEQQAMAANIDAVFIVGVLNDKLNFSRLERYLVSARNCGARPVIVLNKSDLCPDPAEKQKEAEQAANGIPVAVISAGLDRGLEKLWEYLPEGGTCVFVGSSGVGKSTIINRLTGTDSLATGELSDYKDQGRHITSSRNLFLLPNKRMVIDTPGLREMQLWAGGDGLSQTFEDIENLARSCRFNDCRHAGEPGCAVKSAIESGILNPSRYKSYQKMHRELAAHKKRQAMKNKITEHRSSQKKTRNGQRRETLEEE